MQHVPSLHPHPLPQLGQGNAGCNLSWTAVLEHICWGVFVESWRGAGVLISLVGGEKVGWWRVHEGEGDSNVGTVRFGGWGGGERRWRERGLAYLRQRAGKLQVEWKWAAEEKFLFASTPTQEEWELGVACWRKKKGATLSVSLTTLDSGKKKQQESRAAGIQHTSTQ